MPATHLLDTSVFSQPLKPRPLQVALDRWTALGDARLAISVISEAEIRYGLAWKAAAVQHREFEGSLIGRLPILAVDSAVARAYGSIRAELRRLGRPVADLDLLIAATAQVHKLVVATLNPKDFVVVPGLVVEDWSQT